MGHITSHKRKGVDTKYTNNANGATVKGLRTVILNKGKQDPKPSTKIPLVIKIWAVLAILLISGLIFINL